MATNVNVIHKVTLTPKPHTFITLERDFETDRIILRTLQNEVEVSVGDLLGALREMLSNAEAEGF